MKSTNPPLQPTYEMCYVCGARNPSGLKVEFYSEESLVFTEFTPREEHQGYPGYMHGGILGALLDETIGRAAYLRNTWVMTGRLELRYYSLVKVGEKLRITGEIVRERGRAMVLKGEARLEDGKLIAEGSGTFMKLPEEMQVQLQPLIST